MDARIPPTTASPQIAAYGNQETDCVADGTKVIVGVNAYIPKK